MKVSVFMARSLDGFIARSDGDIAWLHEGEALPDGDDAGYSDFFSSVDVLVMGRGTFEKVLEFDEWPYSKPVVVVSKSRKQVPDALRGRVQIEDAAPQDLVEKLAQDGYQHIYLDGGKLVQSFLRCDLVDELTLTTLPILIGDGIPLFGSLENDIQLRHTRTRTWDNGFVQSTYQVKSRAST